MLFLGHLFRIEASCTPEQDPPHVSPTLLSSSLFGSFRFSPTKFVLHKYILRLLRVQPLSSDID